MGSQYQGRQGLPLAAKRDDDETKLAEAEGRRPTPPRLAGLKADTPVPSTTTAVASTSTTRGFIGRTRERDVFAVRAGAGKLSVTLNYHVENRKLVARNQIYLDQFTFGEKVESATATQLPVLLAVSLLKDRNGVIDIDLPISGSLDDPQFSVAGLIGGVVGTMSAQAQNFLRAVLDNGRLAALPEIATQFRALVNARTGEVVGERPWSKIKIALAVLLFTESNKGRLPGATGVTMNRGVWNPEVNTTNSAN